MVESVIRGLIGKPFEYGGRGPDRFDCYGLLMHLYQIAHGVTLPDYRSPTQDGAIAALMANQVQLWEPLPEFTPGYALMFRMLHTTHVGMALTGDRFVHTWLKSGGVTVERFSPWARRSLGCYRFKGL